MTPPTSKHRLFRATFNGKRLEIGRAETEELDPLLGSLVGETVKDTLICWSLVALRWEDERPSEIHALGWRSLTVRTWITSPIKVLDRTMRMIRTHSGGIYRLGEADLDETSPDLLYHLASAFRTWGYDNVVP